MIASVPCGATTEDDDYTDSVGPFSDIGFVYGGGWNGSGSEQIDLGLQYSAANQWSTPFYNAGSGEFPDNNVHFPCDDTFEVDVMIAAGMVFATFCDPDCVTVPGVTLSWQPPSSQWSSWYNGGETMKSMVSIAQVMDPYDDAYDLGVMEDGYGFGLDIIDGDPSIDLDVGFGSCTYTGMAPGNWSASCGGGSGQPSLSYEDFPDDGEIGSIDQSYNGPYWEETDAIDLYDWDNPDKVGPGGRLITWPAPTPTPRATPVPTPVPTVKPCVVKLT